jgi:hypothetical protein
MIKVVNACNGCYETRIYNHSLKDLIECWELMSNHSKNVLQYYDVNIFFDGNGDNYYHKYHDRPGT